MLIEFNNELHCRDFVRLNELWITEHFQIEEADRKLAADPMKIVADGGHIISLVEDGHVVGVCALFKESNNRFQLARMAVEPRERGKGYVLRMYGGVGGGTARVVPLSRLDITMTKRELPAAPVNSSDLVLHFRTTITLERSPFSTNVFEVQGIGLDVPVEDYEIALVHRINSWLPNLLPSIADQLRQYDDELTDRKVFETELVNPTILICPYEGDPPESWSFTLDRSSIPDFGYHSSRGKQKRSSGGGFAWALLFLSGGRMPPPPPQSQIEQEAGERKNREIDRSKQS